jgi:sugar phosphate isomerase/epimerase
MRPALHTLMFSGYPLERVAPIVREIGYDGVALMCQPPHLDLDDPVKSARTAAAVLADSGVQVVGLASGLGRPESFEGRDAESELEGVSRAVEAATILGAGLLRLWGGPDGSTVDDSQGLMAATRWYRRAASIAGDGGVRVTIEIHSIGFASSAAATCQLVDAIDHPNIGAALDTGNLHAAVGSTSAADVQLLGTRVADVHVKDLRGVASGEQHTLAINDRCYLHTPMGEGEVRNGEILAALAEFGYSGWIANESECKWMRWEDSVKAARHEYEALTDLI